MKTITISQIIAMHDRLILKTGGSYGLKDEKLLQAAVAAPFSTWDGVDLYASIQEKAARLAFGLVKNHAFVDGNKRIGVLSMLAFLIYNDVEILCSEDELIDLGLGLATDLISVQDLTEWIAVHTVIV